MQLELVLMLLCNVFEPSRYISNVPLPTVLNHLEATSSYEILKKISAGNSAAVQK
jgi:hypothetical protein